MDQVDGGVGAGGGANRQPHHHQPVEDAAGSQFVRMRTTMREKILNSLNSIGKKPLTSADWWNKVPELAKQLEEVLYRKFPNKIDYYDMMKGPIWPQLQFAIRALSAQQNQRNPQVKRQTSPEDVDLEEAFKNLFLDEEGSGNGSGGTSGAG